ncbi:MAG: hypothetical protein HFF79_01550 [Oscillospiraceae bacterium]|jgi:hypothetical protein|nr:hypothetical protein [Oscillospiraceae bacterium]MCI8878514.1 hypothetical protein [Oscillospiraceae bacterium]
MTEEEKEALYQRALRRRRIALAALAAIVTGVLALLLARLYVHPFYSERRLCSLLEERYGAAFAVRRMPDEGEGRVYQAVCSAWPELELSVRDVWYDGTWDSLFPVWHFPRHAVVDTLRAAAWNRYAVPILAEYGWEGAETGEWAQFNEFGDESGVVIPGDADLDGIAAELAEAVGRIREAPVFSDLLERGERIGYWAVPVLLADGECRVRGTFRLDTDWTEEEVRAELRKLAERLEKRLARQAAGR